MYGTVQVGRVRCLSDENKCCFLSRKPSYLSTVETWETEVYFFRHDIKAIMVIINSVCNEISFTVSPTPEVAAVSWQSSFGVFLA